MLRYPLLVAMLASIPEQRLQELADAQRRQRQPQPSPQPDERSPAQKAGEPCPDCGAPGCDRRCIP